LSSNFFPVPANEQGELQGALTSLISTSIVGPPLMTNIFAYLLTKVRLYMPGAPFLLFYLC
jgi:DHA1 family tetracycline resistance protein-like MFS transporter